VSEKKKRPDDSFRRSTSKSLAPGFVPPKRVMTGQDVKWVDKAACKGVDVSLFFPEDGQNISKEIREMCSGCPVKMSCYIYAEQNHLDNFGVFGGYSPKQRSDLRRVKGRASRKFQQLVA
jgi:phage-related protein